MMQSLLRQVAAKFPGGKLPDNYVVFDTETNGVDPESSVILQVGICFVAKRSIVSSFSQIIRRPDDLYIHPRAYAVHGIDHARMAEEGEPVELVIPHLVDCFNTARRDGFAFLGHNLMKFDARLLEIEASHQYCPFSFGDNEIVDVGMLAKAAQLEVEPLPDESLREFYARVGRIGSTVKWALATYCLERFRLGRFLSQDLIARAHDAGVDCVLSHYTFEVMRDTTFGGPLALRGEA